MTGDGGNLGITVKSGNELNLVQIPQQMLHKFKAEEVVNLSLMVTKLETVTDGVGGYRHTYCQYL